MCTRLVIVNERSGRLPLRSRCIGLRCVITTTFMRSFQPLSPPMCVCPVMHTSPYAQQQMSVCLSVVCVVVAGSNTKSNRGARAHTGRHAPSTAVTQGNCNHRQARAGIINMQGLLLGFSPSSSSTFGLTIGNTMLMHCVAQTKSMRRALSAQATLSIIPAAVAAKNLQNPEDETSNSQHHITNDNHNNQTNCDSRSKHSSTCNRKFPPNRTAAKLTTVFSDEHAACINRCYKLLRHA